jgi:hypothetical protein
MAVGYVAHVSAATTNGANVSVSSATISGAGIASGDLLIMGATTFPRGAGNAAISYGAEIVNTDNGTLSRLRVNWGFWDGSSLVSAAGTSNAADAAALIVIGFNGADLTTPINLTATPATATSTNPDCPAIVPTVDDCMIVVVAGSGVADGSVTLAGGYTARVGSAGNDTNPFAIHGGHRLLTGGSGASEDPPAFGSWGSGAWVGATIALQPPLAVVGQPSVKRMGGVVGANYRSPFGMWRELLLPRKLRWI